jgi:predicted nucleic acid-binding protein
MNADVFIDTNILLYTIDEDPANAAKRQRAQELLLSERWSWSVQVAAEFFVNATSAKRPFKLSAADAAAPVVCFSDAQRHTDIIPRCPRYPAAISIKLLGRRHPRRGQGDGVAHRIQ